MYKYYHLSKVNVAGVNVIIVGKYLKEAMRKLARIMLSTKYLLHLKIH